MSSRDGYIMGSSDAELARLRLQADYLEPVTRRLIKEAGIGPGMRVLDIGCGAGDVSVLLAQAVGPSGRVVAIDREERAIAMARSREREAGHGRIEFVLAADDTLAVDQPFDAAVGRYVLFHQADPVAMVRRAAASVRSGGVVAFHEMVTSVDAFAVPPLDLWTRVARLGFAAVRAAFPYPDAGGRLAPIFADADLPAPDIFCECVVGGPESLAIPWLVTSCQTMLPIMDRLGLDRSAVGDFSTLRERLVAAARPARTQFILNPQACAWTVRP